MHAAAPSRLICLALLAQVGQSFLPVPVGAAVRDERKRATTKHYQAGQEALLAKQWHSAAYEFSLAIENDPLMAAAHYGLGRAFLAQRQYSDAIRALLDCQHAYKRLAAAERRDAILDDQRRDLEIQSLKDAIAYLRSTAGRISQRGQGGETAEVTRIEGRIRALERAKHQHVSSSDSPAEVSLSLGSAYFRAGALEDAERAFRVTIGSRPGLGEAHNNLAVIYMLTGRYSQARSALGMAEKAGFRIHPQFKKDLEHRAQAASGR